MKLIAHLRTPDLNIQPPMSVAITLTTDVGVVVYVAWPGIPGRHEAVPAREQEARVSAIAERLALVERHLTGEDYARAARDVTAAEKGIPKYDDLPGRGDEKAEWARFGQLVLDKIAPGGRIAALEPPDKPAPRIFDLPAFASARIDGPTGHVPVVVADGTGAFLALIAPAEVQSTGRALAVACRETMDTNGIANLPELHHGDPEATARAWARILALPALTIRGHTDVMFGLERAEDLEP